MAILHEDVQASVERHLQGELSDSVAWAGADFNTEDLTAWVELFPLNETRINADPGVDQGELLYQVSCWAKTGTAQETTKKAAEMVSEVKAALFDQDIPIRATTGGTITGYLTGLRYQVDRVPTEITTLMHRAVTWGAILKTA